MQDGRIALEKITAKRGSDARTTTAPRFPQQGTQKYRTAKQGNRASASACARVAKLMSRVASRQGHNYLVRTSCWHANVRTVSRCECGASTTANIVGNLLVTSKALEASEVECT